MKTINSIIIILGLILSSCVPEGYSPVSSRHNEKIYVKHNEFKDLTFYRHKAFFNANSADYSPVEIYIGENEYGNQYLRIEFTYNQGDWIFFTDAIIKNSRNDKVVFSFNSYEKTTDVHDYSVFEEIDESLPDNKAKRIRDLIKPSGGKIKVRLSGEGYEDYVLEQDTVNALRKILKRYFEK